ncbi:MAG: hypothetical protein IPH44_21315 [Myxococcales bacterium]|nr:hypothetical protein [Myxococcales bacterium]
MDARWRSGCGASCRSLPAFLDGLVSANTTPVAELVIAMANGDDDDRGLAAALACQLPCDDAHPALLALVEHSQAPVRVSTLRALALIGDVDPIFARLDDPSPRSPPRAALALVDLGELSVRTRRPDDPSLVCRAAVFAPPAPPTPRPWAS